MRSLLDQLDGVACIDDSRIYAAGVSNGGGFVSRIACQLNDRLAGVASVAGLYGREPACRPQHALAVIEIHGTADRTVPYNGWPAKGVASVWAFLTKWASWDSCPPAPAAWRRVGPGSLLESRTGCADGTSIFHVKLRGEPHAWPTPQWWLAHRKAVGVPFDASLAVVQFFATGNVAAQTSPR